MLIWYRSSTFKWIPLFVIPMFVRQLYTTKWITNIGYCAVCWCRNKSKYFTGLFRRHFRVHQFGRCLSERQRTPMSVQRTAVWCAQQHVFRTERDVLCLGSRCGYVRQHSNRRWKAVRKGVGMLSQMAGTSTRAIGSANCSAQPAANSRTTSSPPAPPDTGLALCTAEGSLAVSATWAGDTLSSRHVSSCDLTRAVGMWI
jgi:hypothetical protein